MKRTKRKPIGDKILHRKPTIEQQGLHYKVVVNSGTQKE